MHVAAKRITPPDEPAATNVVAMPARLSPRTLVPQSDAVIDRALLSRLADGDQSAFATLMQRHLSAVLSTARRIVRDDAEAEDIAQDAFLRLWSAAATLEAGEHGLRPWLRRVASNLAIDWLRKARRFAVTDEVPEQADPVWQLRNLEATEVSGRIEQALSVLPQRQRIAVSLFHFDDLSQREVAALMELSEDALESLLARGRRRLRDELKDDWQTLLINHDHPT